MIKDPDSHIRSAAFAALEKLTLGTSGRLSWQDVQRGFSCGGEIICFAGRAVGIFKPKQMSAALSIRTVRPREGRQRWYRDQVENFHNEYGLRRYDMARGGLENPSNRHLEEAWRRQAPLVYFIGVAPAVYEAVWPVWIEHFSEEEGSILLAAADLENASISSVQAIRRIEPDLIDTSYSLRKSKHRNHQAWFSSHVKTAYGYRCAFSGLPLRNLLVGAHILPDAEGGPASVANGICMSTLHHSAFDADLIGVDPDFRIHVGTSVRSSRDGPLLEGLKELHGSRLNLPGERSDYPDRDFLDRRFERFRQGNSA